MADGGEQTLKKNESLNWVAEWQSLRVKNIDFFTGAIKWQTAEIEVFSLTVVVGRQKSLRTKNLIVFINPSGWQTAESYNQQFHFFH